MRESPEDIEKLKANFPLMDAIYPLPVETIRSLDIPALDLSVYGIGAHTWKRDSINLILSHSSKGY